MQSHDFIVDNIKRNRRLGREIPRAFHCPVGKCNRSYGSEGSLAHHVRLKHMPFYERGDYEIWAQANLNWARKPAKVEKKRKVVP